MPLIEGAFKRAQEKARAARDMVPDPGMVDSRRVYDRALIEAYLGDADVVREFTLALYGSASENDLAATTDAFLAIGARREDK